MNPRIPNTASHGQPFEQRIIDMVWLKGQPSENPKIRFDACGAPMHFGLYGKTDNIYGWEIDHIKPIAKGGGDDLTNLQPLQWQNNRSKSDDWPHWSCTITS